MKSFFCKQRYSSADGAWLCLTGIQVGEAHYLDAVVTLIFGALILASIEYWFERKTP